MAVGDDRNGRVMFCHLREMFEASSDWQPVKHPAGERPIDLEADLETAVSAASGGTGPGWAGPVFETPEADHGSQASRLKPTSSSPTSLRQGGREARSGCGLNGSPDGSRVEVPDPVGTSSPSARAAGGEMAPAHAPAPDGLASDHTSGGGR